MLRPPTRRCRKRPRIHVTTASASISTSQWPTTRVVASWSRRSGNPWPAATALIDVTETNARAHHARECAAGRLDTGCDLVQDLDGLAVRVAPPHHLATAVGRRGAAHRDAVAAG
jgi:hypothetical protein